jgi:ketosteroid isomerase-like protein
MPAPAGYCAEMPQANVERVKAGFAAHNRGDMDALVEFYDPEVVFETLLLGTHHGNEAIPADLRGEPKNHVRL